MSTPHNLLDAPSATGMLPDIPGGEPNLLPLTALDQPLPVQVPMWPISYPQPSSPETLWVYLNNTLVYEKTWTAPVPPADLRFTIASEHRQEGSHRLHYRVMSFNEEEVGSEDFIITVDRTAPVLGGNGGRLVFDVTEVTAAYLEQNNDRLIGTAPDYVTVRPGDVIRWYWDTGFEEDALVSERTLTQQDVGKPLELIFDGEMIRARGDGTRMARYRVWDRAGNVSAYSTYMNLVAKANVPPRQFGWPNIKEASGGTAKVTLDPLRVLAYGATVQIPEAAGIRDDDVVWVQWGEKDAPGSFRTDASVSPGVYEFRVPKEFVAFHITRTLLVRYEVIDAQGREYLSEPRQVEVLRVDADVFTTVQCEGVAGNDALSLASVPANGAALTLDPWVLISEDQVITIKVQGLSSAGATETHTIIDKRRLTADEVADGVGMDGKDVIPKEFLAGLRLNFPFNVMVTVSFDQGQTWSPVPNFTRLNVNLVA